MPRYLIGLVVGFVAMVGLVGISTGAFGLYHTESNMLAQPSTPTPQASVPSQTQPLPPELAFVQGMTADERFDRVVGAQVTIRNPQGQDVIVNAVPGRVASIATNVVTITPNQASQTRSFTVTPDTVIMGRPRRGSLTIFSQGDRVVVYVIDNNPNAVAIVEPSFMMAMMDMMMGQTGMMPSMMGGQPRMTGTPTAAAHHPVPTPTTTPSS
ncbi:MAG TPA: hypothetical protein VNL16_09955 [Chloroflexota bacterium]|nr:hypothetical protein [Chloroflexota bacterium]